MDLVKCPFCDKEIEKDSFYCDQCGQELKICPTHGFKKGKICNECGTKLVEAKNAAGEFSAALQPTSPAVAVNSQVQSTSAASQTTVAEPAPAGQQPLEAAPEDTPEKTVRPVAVPAEPKCLVSGALNARLDLRDGAVVGRRTGDYTNVFADRGYVSGSHARLQRNGAGQWEVVDLDSSNGTFLNGQKLAANQPCAFKIGDTIAFYDLKFIVE